MTLYRDFNYSGINVLIQKFSAYLSLTVPTNDLGILLNAECGMEISRGAETLHLKQIPNGYTDPETCVFKLLLEKYTALLIIE